MGLTISYTLKLKSATIEEVREKIIALKKIALTFPPGCFHSQIF